MHSLNRHVANTRIARVYDTAVGAQGDSKGMKAHTSDLRAAVEPTNKQVAAGLQDFIQQAAKAGAGVKRGK